MHGNVHNLVFNTAHCVSIFCSQAKRSLYIAIRHCQIALDVITEEDIEDGLVNSYALVFLSAPHIRTAAATALVDWVAKGGTLLGSVGMGMLNEFN